MIMRAHSRRPSPRSIAALLAAVVAAGVPAAHAQLGDRVKENTPILRAGKDHTVFQPEKVPLRIFQEITAFSPTVGAGGTQVILTGLRPFVAPTAVRFGGLPASSFSRRPDGTIAATAPQTGVGGSAVRISVVDKGVVSESAGLFSYRIADMEVTGPLPLNPSEIGDPRWYNGRGHLIRSWAPATLSFSQPPVFHVAVSFGDDSMAYPPNYTTPPFNIGNYATYSAHLQTCDVSTRPASGATGCKNWDGNTGTWTDVGPTATTRIDSLRPNVSAFADLALPTQGLFDEANLVRTLRLSLGLQQNDTHRSTGDRVDNKDTAPFIAIVAPAAFVQVKVIPFTIVYQPPGNASTASYQTQTTYSTAFKLGNSTEQSNAATSQQTLSSKAAIKLTIPLGGSSASFGMDLGETWDQSTKMGFATSAGSTDSTTASLTLQTTWNLPANTDLVPGNGDTCLSATDCSTLAHPASVRAIAPFWADTFVFLVHPQFAVWVMDAGRSRFVMTAAVPVTADATVAQLAACWQGSISWPGTNPCELQYAHVVPTASEGGVVHARYKAGGGRSGQVVYSGAADHVTLTPEEAHRFLLLDPFFRAGQSAAVRADRAINIASAQYGARIGERPRPITLSLSRNIGNITEKTGATTTTVSITSIRGSDTAFNVGESLFGVLGMNGGETRSSKTNVSSDLKATFTDSTVVTRSDATSAQVVLNDLDVTSGGCAPPHCHLPLPQRPAVNVFLDRTFGGFMFQDPAAGVTPAADASAPTSALRAETEAAIAAVKNGTLRGARLIRGGPTGSSFKPPAVFKAPRTRLPH